MSDSPIPSFLRAIDALDLEAVLALFGPDASVSMPFGEEANGEQGLRDEFTKFLSELRATQHQLGSHWNPDPDVWIAEFSATYELTDFSRRGPYKRALIVRTGDGLIEQMSIYGAHELPLPESGHPYERVRGPNGWLPTL
jgi:ketosteroid isomerase-like protein